MVESLAELNKAGVRAWESGDRPLAAASYRLALNFDPDYAPALWNMAGLLLAENKPREAAAHIGRLIALRGREPRFLNVLAECLLDQERFEEAGELLLESLRIERTERAWRHMACVHRAFREFDKARACLVLAAGWEYVPFDTAVTLLGEGKDLQAGLEAFEARWEENGLAQEGVWKLGIPEWKGEPLRGKRILVHAEQGIGDTIMVVRFVKALADSGARVACLVQHSLNPLFESQGWPVVFIDEVYAGDHFDYHSPMFSVMRWLGLGWEDICPEPYLKAPASSAPLSDGINIGIVWASGLRADPKANRRRVVSPLSEWLSLATIPNVRLWSLQYDEAKQELYAGGMDGLIRDPIPGFADWAATAAFVSRLDLVVSVDTAIVHLAGALGKRCIMLTQYVPCWRWRDFDGRTGRPWYGSVEIVPQETVGGWGAQLKRVGEMI